MTAPTEPVVIVGGGFSGLMVALHLLADPDGPAVVLVDRSGRPGRGVAYGTEDPRHLLNVRAGAMGAFPDRPEDFLAWLRGPGGAPETSFDDFVQRRLYGDYLRDLLAAARLEHAGRLRVLEEEVVAVRRSGAGVVAWLADGRAVVGLPGNPASALVCAELFVKPVLRAMMGADPEPRFVRARLAQSMPANGGRDHLVRVLLEPAADGVLTARALGDQDSSLVTVFAQADGLLRRPAGSPRAEAGELADVLVLARL